MNPLDDAKSDYSSLERPKQPVLSVGEWMTIMQALRKKVERKADILKSTFGTKAEREYLKEDMRLTKLLYDKLKEAGFSES